jgi:MoaA/NifB/PqqE/SkfB family radical SAM enzyme
LSCPACPRTWFAETFNRPFPKQDLDIDHLERFLDCNSGEHVKEFMLNGNHGDPIYYPKLFDLLSRFRKTKKFKISTNGSYQDVEFWTKLRDSLTTDDTVFFSIDGLAHNNHLYRRNSDWESIIKGIDIMRNGPAKIVCKTLIFSYNINELDKIKDFAESKGMHFLSETTSRFGDNSLNPGGEQIDKARLYENNINTSLLTPQCSTEEYISADGYYWPCCLITSYFTLFQTSLWKERELWSIQNQTLDQARNRLEIWKQKIIDDPNNAHSVCKMNCKAGQQFKWAKF